MKTSTGLTEAELQKLRRAENMARKVRRAWIHTVFYRGFGSNQPDKYGSFTQQQNIAAE